MKSIIPRIEARIRSAAAMVLLAGLAAFVILAGCGRDARLADRKVHSVPFGTITAYGKTLDQSAGPKEVVYVLLRAVFDDYKAGENIKERDKAIDVELGLAARQRLLDLGARTGRLKGLEDDEFVYQTVFHWAPTLGHYAHDFDSDFDTLAERMLFVQYPGAADRPPEGEIFLNVTHPDPKKRPNANAVARIALVKEEGFWRIWWVGWENSTRDWKTKPPALAAAHPASTRQ